jgi:large subunit ribosomal protein L25
MKTIQIKGSLRQATGKKASKELRTNLNVPCVLYGGEEVIHFYGFENDFRHIVYTPNVFIAEIDIDGKVYRGIMQDLQFHPVSERLLHMDFLRVFDDKEVKIQIPVKTYGFAKGVKAGGVLQLMKRKLKVQGLPGNLPDSLDINIEDLGIGKSLKVRDLVFDNLKILDPQASVICAIKMTRAAMSTLGAAGTETEE